MPVTASILRRFPNPVFIETGTFHGDGVRAALDAGFPAVVSIEIAPELHARAHARYLKESRARLLCGSSADLLTVVLAGVTSPATFFLDAHGYAGDGDADNPCPLLAELDAIARHDIKTHTVLIDDFNVFGRKFRAGVTEEAVRERLGAAFPHHLLVRMDNPHLPWDILGALPWTATHDDE